MTILPYTLWSTTVSINKMNMMKLHTLKVWNALTALSHYIVAWTFVVTNQVKCLTFRSKVKLKGTLTSNDPETFWGHKLGQTDRTGRRDLCGHKVGHVGQNRSRRPNDP